VLRIDDINSIIKYSVQLHSPLGIKAGELLLEKVKNEITGKLCILKTECNLNNIKFLGDTFEFKCIIKTIIGDIFCEVKLTDNSGILYGVVQTNKGCMAVTGMRLSV